MRKTSSHITDEQAENIIKIFDSFNGNYNDIDDTDVIKPISLKGNYYKFGIILNMLFVLLIL